MAQPKHKNATSVSPFLCPSMVMEMGNGTDDGCSGDDEVAMTPTQG